MDYTVTFIGQDGKTTDVVECATHMDVQNVVANAIKASGHMEDTAFGIHISLNWKKRA